MRTPEELENYFMSSNRGEGNSLSFKDFIAEIQKDSYNQAIEDVLKFKKFSSRIANKIKYVVDEEDILKLKIK